MVHLVPNIQTLAGHAPSIWHQQHSTKNQVFIPALDILFFAKIKCQWQLVQIRMMVSNWLKGGAQGLKIQSIKTLV